MKKSILVTVTAAALMLFSGNTAIAQEKGDMFAGGSIGIQVKNAECNLGFIAEFGYFFCDNFRCNLGLGYNHFGNGDNTYKYSTDAFIVNPEVSYYFKIIDKLYYTPEFGASFGWGSATTRYFEPSVSYHNPEFEWNVYLNFASFEYKPVKYLGFTLGLGSLSFGGVNERIDGTEDSKYQGVVQFSLLASCSVGAKFYF